MNEQEWLDSLKPGDRVIVCGRWANSLRTVERLTKTQIVLKGSKFRKSDGGLVGADSYNYAYLRSPTEQRVNDIMHQRACDKIGKVAWKVLPLETLNKVLEIVG